MKTILFGRQLAVSWCTPRVNFDAGLNHSPPAARLPLRIGRSVNITGGLNVFSVRSCKGTQNSSWMSQLARRSTGTDRHILEACFARGGGLQASVSCYGLLPLVGRSCVATVCCHLRFGCNWSCSPAPWSQPMILGGFDAFLLRCVRWYAAYCAFWMLCGTRASNVCV